MVGRVRGDHGKQDEAMHFLEALPEQPPLCLGMRAERWQTENTFG